MGIMNKVVRQICQTDFISMDLCIIQFCSSADMLDMIECPVAPFTNMV